MRNVVKKAYDYHIITSALDAKDLEVQVRIAMQHGYEPIGGVAVRFPAMPQWAQAVVKYDYIEV